MRTEFAGSILDVRAVEDTIRATHKYTEGLATRGATHPLQGADFPSKVLTKHYEVYPGLDLEQERTFWESAFLASDWLWGDLPRVDVVFWYSYLGNKGKVIVQGGENIVALLRDSIPGFGGALDKVGHHAEDAVSEQQDGSSVQPAHQAVCPNR